MSDFVITTENAADLPQQFIQENEIGILSLYYTIDGVTYGPDHSPEMSAEEFYAKMRAGSMPKTQQVNPDQAIRRFREYLQQGKDILHIALTSAVSGSCNSARMAAEELKEEFPERTITVIDTLVGTLCEGMIVDKVVQMRKAGKSLSQAAQWVKDNIPHFCLYATVDDGTLFPEPTQFHDALCTGDRSGERPKEASDVITIMESQIDAVLDTFRYVQKENENHPDDPYTVACIYLSASTDTLIQRSYERELNYSPEYQNWEEAMRRIVSEIDPKYGSRTPYHPMVQKLLNPKVLNEVTNRPNLLQVYDLEGGFFPAPIVEIGGEYYGESLLLRGPLTAPYFDTMVLPPFFYLKVDDCTVEESVTGVTYLIDWMRYHRLTKQEVYLEWAKVVAKPHVLSRSDIACNSLLLRFGSDE